MAYIEIIKNGIHTILNEASIVSVYHIGRGLLQANDYKRLPKIDMGEFILVIEKATENIYIPFEDDMDAVAAYETIKKQLSPKVVIL